MRPFDLDPAHVHGRHRRREPRRMRLVVFLYPVSTVVVCIMGSAGIPVVCGLYIGPRVRVDARVVAYPRRGIVHGRHLLVPKKTCIIGM